jgi:glycosyltransferase involved in cell wall biosynthesis
MNGPTVSVILPVYNGERYLRLAIESVLAQTFTDFELIVIDDGSTDSSPAVAKAFGDRLRYARQNNGGVASAFNHGLSLARGQYISWLSHDDLFEPAKLEMQWQALNGYPRPAVCYTDAAFIDAGGAIKRTADLPDHKPAELLRNLFISGPVGMSAYSLFYDRRCIDDVGLYDESQPDTQDADMLIRLARHFPFVHVPRQLIKIREHGGRDSYNKRWTREALKFYTRWSNELRLEELFPDLVGTTTIERARARMWLGDRYLSNEIPPFRKLAMIQYGKAIRENAGVLPGVSAKIAWFLAGPGRRFIKNHRHFYRLGLRTALARRYGDVKKTPK